MKTCRNCGNVEPDMNMFCTVCGSRLENEAPPVNTGVPGGGMTCTCGAPIYPGDAFCTACGKPVGGAAPAGASGKTCPQCGQIAEESDLFCTSCG